VLDHSATIDGETTEAGERPLLELRHLSKRFPGVTALDDVSLDLHRGEVLVLVGENGAGKSTLVKILSGIYQPDEGEIVIDGQTATLPDPHAAQERGISTVHQELNLVPHLDVGRNIFLGG
jgi:ABC-type sugar transport system ATPase subunit